MSVLICIGVSAGAGVSVSADDDVGVTTGTDSDAGVSTGADAAAAVTNGADNDVDSQTPLQQVISIELVHQGGVVSHLLLIFLILQPQYSSQDPVPGCA